MPDDCEAPIVCVVYFLSSAELLCADTVCIGGFPDMVQLWLHSIRTQLDYHEGEEG